MHVDRRRRQDSMRVTRPEVVSTINPFRLKSRKKRKSGGRSTRLTIETTPDRVAIWESGRSLSGSNTIKLKSGLILCLCHIAEQ